MAEEELDTAYARILEQERARGGLVEGRPGAERRRHPRIRVQPGELPVEIDPWVFAIDMSISGMAFFAERPAQRGETVNLALGDMMTVDAEVMDCHQEPGELPGQPERYRLHCRFADEEAGKRLLVAIKELEAGAAPD